MISATLLAALMAAPAAGDAPSASVFLKAAAAAAPKCQVTRVDEKLVRAPLFSPASAECPVAKVGDEAIVLGELAEALEAGHMSRSRRGAGKAKRPDMDFTPALDRLVTTRLLVQEAREMQLDTTPEFQGAMEDFKASRLRTMVQELATRDAKPDPADVERRYREAVRQLKLKSVLIEKEEDAKAFAAALKAGQGFDAVAKRFVAEKKARGGGKAEFVSPDKMLPELAEAAQTAKRGVPVGPVRVAAGWVALRVDGVRYPPNDAAARAQARGMALRSAQQQAIRQFYVGLVKKHATVDEALLKSIDFEANGEKGFEKLLEDQRPLVKIAGEKPVTVGELTRTVAMNFFHGIESPIQQKRVNVHKAEAFEKLLGARLFAKEAAARKLDARPEYRREVEDYARAMVFGTFVEKVIRPEVKVTEDEAMRHYETRKADYTAPQMYKLDGIAFASSREAQAALEKLKAGTDFAWFRTSAPGQLPPERRSLSFDGSTVSAKALPADLAKALTNATAGAYRLFGARQDEVYVIRVVDQIAPAPQPYVEARETIAKKLYNDKLTQAMRDYADKLRKAQRVEVLITRVAM